MLAKGHSQPAQVTHEGAKVPWSEEANYPPTKGQRLHGAMGVTNCRCGGGRPAWGRWAGGKAPSDVGGGSGGQKCPAAEGYGPWSTQRGTVPTRGADTTAGGADVCGAGGVLWGKEAVAGSSMVRPEENRRVGLGSGVRTVFHVVPLLVRGGPNWQRPH